MQTRILAHRGASCQAPENTHEAFELALAQGADGLEIDVQMTRDGVLVVAHDETLARVTEASGDLKDWTYHDLSDLDFAAKSPLRRGRARLPRLSDVLELCRGGRGFLNIELKNSVYFYPNLEEATLELVRDMGMEEAVCFSSFNHVSMLHMKSLGCRAPLGLLYGDPLVFPWWYAEQAGVAAIHPHHRNLLFPGLVTACHERGIAVNTWTVDAPKDIERALRLGVDILISNVPERALAVRDALQSKQ